ncbi:MAG: biotin carboxylase N-terminal domain-containing protein [Bdellovibrionota bacterium]
MKRVLIANRGEIAARVLRACKKLGLETVAVYSDADSAAPYLALADAKAHLGPAAASESYLRIDKLIAAAKANSADAVHPGYGFLAESPEFADAVENAGLIFVGPSATVMKRAGHKDSARKAAAAVGLPIPPGYDALDQSENTLVEAARGIGVPLLVKAAAGGGGRGMRLVRDLSTLDDSIVSAAREAKAFFGDGRLILERYIAPARHIEVQLIADRFGSICHLFERDCSLQRRYQKVIEIGPAPALPNAIRSALFEASLKLGQSLQLVGAATVEFLVPSAPQAGEPPFYFLEINPRVQVEHPVTELITGMDIVELQLRVARGERLAFAQSDVGCSGAAIEARICAEVPSEQFRPSGGTIGTLTLPQASSNLRLDHALAEGLEIASHYDSLLLKLIAYGGDHASARQTLIEALARVSIGGLETNQRFLIRLLESSPELHYHTTFIDSQISELSSASREESEFFASAAVAASLGFAYRSAATSDALRFFRMNRAADGTRCIFAPSRLYRVESSLVDSSVSVEARVIGWRDGALSLVTNGQILNVTAESDFSVAVESGSKKIRATLVERKGADGDEVLKLQMLGSVARVQMAPLVQLAVGQEESTGKILSPLPGRVLSLPFAAGSEVLSGDCVAVIESMKMEHSLNAKSSGTVKEVLTKVGDSVKAGDIIVLLEPTELVQSSGS